MKNINKSLMLGSLILFGIMFVSFVSSEMLISDAGVEYDSEILTAFENQMEIPVIVNIRANISSNYSNSVKSSEYQLYVEDIQRQIDEIKNNFIMPSEEEFKFDNWIYLKPSFYGNITKEGFEKLIDNNKIQSIIINEATYTSFNEEDMLTQTKETIREKNLIYFWIIGGIF